MPPRDGLALKTDDFEEAFGEDALLGDLAQLGKTWIAMDVAATTVLQARARLRLPTAGFLVCDARRMPMRPGSFEVVVSNSTLDHFDTRLEFETAVRALAAVLRPGGRLLITVDNSRNPFYFPLRWLSKIRLSPFELGYTPSAQRLLSILEEAGLRVIATSSLIHNPRVVSTILFLIIRRVMGARADGIIQWFLNAFAQLERLPTREFSACFVAACAARPEAPFSL